jgi:c-di-GMP-binding flagellar brake protein YcgR
MSLLHFRRIERRRTARAVMSMNLLVYGETAEGEKFRYWTKSISVSAFGGVLLLEREFPVGQGFNLLNEFNKKKASAKVVAVRTTKDGLVQASFEFCDAVDRFWSMTFPAAGAKPMRKPCGKTV